MDPLKRKNKPTYKQAREGSLVQLFETDDFGIVVENLFQYGLNGARILWTSKGYVAWTPWFCLDVVSEETESSVDEHSKREK